QRGLRDLLAETGQHSHTPVVRRGGWEVTCSFIRHVQTGSFTISELMRIVTESGVSQLLTEIRKEGVVVMCQCVGHVTFSTIQLKFGLRLNYLLAQRSQRHRYFYSRAGLKSRA